MPVYGPPEKDLNQGDVLLDVEFLIRRRHDVDWITTAGMVTSNGCDIDKFYELGDSRNQKLSWPLTVAPAYGLDSLDSGQAGDVRGDRHRRYFYVPAEAAHPEMMVDLWLQQPIPLVVLRTLPRRATLSPEWLARLWQHAFVTFTRRDPHDVFIGGRLSAP